MKRLWILFLGVVLFVFYPAMGYSSERWDVDLPASRISFSGRSTLHSFNGQAHAISGYLQSAGETEEVFQGRISVETSQLDTLNIKRDRNMKRMLKIEQYPQIVFDVHSVKKVVSGDGQTFHLEGQLTIAGTARDIATDVKWLNGQGEIKLTGHFKVSLSNFDLHPPSVIGIIRVSNDVQVDFEVVFKRSSSVEN